MKNINRFVLNTTGDEVTDTQSGLIWKRCFEGQSFDGVNLTGEPEKLTWDAAMAYAAAQPDGWRLPTLEEFRELYVVDKPEEELFLDEGWAWSASPGAAGTDYAWVVLFVNGYVYWDSKYGNGSVRLVRGQ